MSDNLTLDALLKIKDKLTTTLHYATSDLVEKGSGIVVKSDPTALLSFSKYFVCHLNDMKQIKESNLTVKFVHLSKAPMQTYQPPLKYKQDEHLDDT